MSAILSIFLCLISLVFIGLFAYYLVQYKKEVTIAQNATAASSTNTTCPTCPAVSAQPCPTCPAVSAQPCPTCPSLSCTPCPTCAPAATPSKITITAATSSNSDVSTITKAFDNDPESYWNPMTSQGVQNQIQISFDKTYRVYSMTMILFGDSDGHQPSQVVVTLQDGTAVQTFNIPGPSSQHRPTVSFVFDKPPVASSLQLTFTTFNSYQIYLPEISFTGVPQ